MKKLTSKVKKTIISSIVLGILLVPGLRVNYFNGNGLEVKNYSIITSLIEDVKERSFMTPSIVAGNLKDRAIETYNDIKYK